jgi:peptidyl-dipeptidase Dcp
MSCNKENKAESIGKDNPLLAVYDTPYEVPPFDLIKNDHFKPAILEAIQIHQNEIDAITNNSDQHSFENTIEALDKNGKLLNSNKTVF